MAQASYLNIFEHLFERYSLDEGSFMNHDLETLFINEGKLQRFNQNRETFEPYMSIEELKVLTKRPSNGPRLSASSPA
jgi:hypothetical protein